MRISSYKEQGVSSLIYRQWKATQRKEISQLHKENSQGLDGALVAIGRVRGDWGHRGIVIR